MITFEELYKKVNTVSHETAFNIGEISVMYDLLTNMIDDANVVEIGVEFGRSTSVIGLIAKEKNFDFVAIDNYKQDNGEEARRNVEEVLIGQWKLPIQLWVMSSAQARQKYNKDIDFIHIDGDHTFQGVTRDMEKWLPKVCKGGYVCFDDYGHDSLPEVFSAVSMYMDTHKEFRFIGRYGNKLGVFERI